MTLPGPGSNLDTRPRRAPAPRIDALEGLRGVAVLTVVVYHLWPGVMPGGYLGVSLFFTLSGYVITRSLLQEREASGSVDIRRFWVRRLRRLIPAATVVLASIATGWTLLRWMTPSFAGDLLASLTYTENWRILLRRQGYADAGQSPTAHFWSLAIEMQFYLLVPLLLARRRLRARGMVAFSSTALVLSILVTVIYAGNLTTVYFSTFTRGAEILAGVMLALLAHHRAAAVATVAHHRAAPVIGGISLIIFLVACRTFSYDHASLSRGLLLATASLSSAVILFASGSNAFARLLAFPVLVRLGTISYGLYLIHWPVREAATRLISANPTRPWVILIISVIAAQLSFTFIERPFRVPSISRRRARVSTLAFGMLAATTLALGIVPQVGAYRYDFEQTVDRLNESTGAPGTNPPSESGGSPRLRVAVFGDSTALNLAFGWFLVPTGPRYVGSASDLGCTIGRTGLVRGNARYGDDPYRPQYPLKPKCDWTDQWPAKIRQIGGADVAVVLIGSWDSVGRKVPALGPEWRTLQDPVYREWLLSEIIGASSSLRAAGVPRVALLTLPHPFDEPRNKNIDIYNSLLYEAASSRKWLRVIDYASYIRRADPNFSMRPDGIHLTLDGAEHVVTDWLGAQITSIAGEQ